MKFFPLVWAMLWRSRSRTWLTFFSIAVAFLLFGLLQAVQSAFLSGVRAARDDHLIVTFRQGLDKPLPYAYLGRLEKIPGVRVVQPTAWAGGWYQDPHNQISAFAVDPKKAPEVETRAIMPAEQQKAFETTRTGALAGRDLTEKFGWKIGDRITLKGGLPKKDGSTDWSYDIVGIFEYDDKKVGSHVPAPFLIVNFDYVNQASQWSDYVTWYTVCIRDPAQAGAISRAIDGEFLNSDFETRTQSEQEFSRGFLKQLGDVGLLMTGILSAVFFTLILVAGNSMMQAFRERQAELAVLKTVGFTDAQVVALAVGESLLLSLIAASTGLGLALAALPAVRGIAPLPGLAIEPNTLLTGIALAAGVGLIAAAIPAWKSARLSVIEGLATPS